MTITVAIPSYGYGHLVLHALDSVLSQTRRPDKILVIDDGAKDFPKDDLLCGISKEYNVDFILKDKNSGVLDTFNDILFNRVSTDRLMLLGADNWLRQDAVEKLMEHDEDIVTYWLYLTGAEWKNANVKNKCDRESNGYPIRRFKNYENIAQRIMRSNVIHGSSLYDVKLARSVGGYERAGNTRQLNEDWGLWRKMIAAGATHHAIEEPLMFYRRHKANFYGVY